VDTGSAPRAHIFNVPLGNDLCDVTAQWILQSADADPLAISNNTAEITPKTIWLQKLIRLIRRRIEAAWRAVAEAEEEEEVVGAISYFSRIRLKTTGMCLFYNLAENLR
jgi:hypothetical protein